MFNESINYFKFLILRNRRFKKCTEYQARHAWNRVASLSKKRSFNEAFVHVLHDVALYGKALGYVDVIHGMSQSLKEGTQ